MIRLYWEIFQGQTNSLYLKYKFQLTYKWQKLVQLKNSGCLAKAKLILPMAEIDARRGLQRQLKKRGSYSLNSHRSQEIIPIGEMKRSGNISFILMICQQKIAWDVITMIKKWNWYMRMRYTKLRNILLVFIHSKGKRSVIWIFSCVVDDSTRTKINYF